MKAHKEDGRRLGILLGRTDLGRTAGRARRLGPISWAVPWVYTRPAGEAFLTATPDKRKGIRSSSEPWATLAAELVRERLGTTWGLAETGASGPTGNSYGDPAGHTCVAVVGPKGKIARTLRTGSNDRVANMRAFAAEALKLMDEQLS